MKEDEECVLLIGSQGSPILTERVKSFGLKEAIIYSYFRDIRFVLVLCAMLGFSVWWFTAPETLLLKPGALIFISPDL